MSEKVYVSFEVAKLLKEKGFDWKLYSYFSKASEDSTPVRTAFAHNFNDEYCGSLSRPTQPTACDWLREEKNIYITAVPDIGNSLRFYPAIYVIKGEITEEYWFEYINSVVEELNKSYPNPQQAVDAALKYTLTNLI